MEWIGIVTWLLVILGICIEPLCGQHTVTPDSEAALNLGRCADTVILRPLNQILLSGSIYQVTRYVDSAPYLNYFNTFESYLVSFNNDLKSPDNLAHFQTVDTTHIIGGIYDVLNFPNIDSIVLKSTNAG